MLVRLGVVGILLHLTEFGRHTSAIGSNADAARRVGINVPGHLVKVYALAGALSGFGGVLSLARLNTTSIGGHQSDPLEAIAAAALGGTSVFGGAGSIAGTVVGVWIPGVLRNGIIILGVQPYWQGIIIGLVLVATVWFDQYRRRVAGGIGGLRRMRLRSSSATHPPTKRGNHEKHTDTRRRVRRRRRAGVAGHVRSRRRSEHRTTRHGTRGYRSGSHRSRRHGSRRYQGGSRADVPGRPRPEPHVRAG